MVAHYRQEASSPGGNPAPVLSEACRVAVVVRHHRRASNRESHPVPILPRLVPGERPNRVVERAAARYRRAASSGLVHRSHRPNPGSRDSAVVFPWMVPTGCRSKDPWRSTWEPSGSRPAPTMAASATIPASGTASHCWPRSTVVGGATSRSERLTRCPIHQSRRSFRRRNRTRQKTTRRHWADRVDTAGRPARPDSRSRTRGCSADRTDCSCSSLTPPA